jgi:hypothetical protein
LMPGRLTARLLAGLLDLTIKITPFWFLLNLTIISFFFCFAGEEQDDQTDEEDDPGLEDLDEDDNLMSPASLIQLEDSIGPGNISFCCPLPRWPEQDTRTRRLVNYNTN